MSDYAKILSLSYNSATATRTIAKKTFYRSVRLIKDTNVLTPTKPSTYYSVLLNGNCLDQENRKLYTFYLDTYYNQAWIFEIDIDTRAHYTVFFGATNQLGFDGAYKIYNARVVQGTLIWTDNKNSVYQMNISRAKNSFYYGIGYGAHPEVTAWNEYRTYVEGEIVWRGRYFYKNIISTALLDPVDFPEYWERLCLVEEAYYSTKKENYYFAPLPPAFGPIPEYFSDSSRKPNNLRQTIWQFAYRYVYMDYRKSTFSPACVPDMPEGEEDVATGLANEHTELNNSINIKINTGGEDVRKIEVIGRSSDNPSTWYLIDVIDKFDELEGTGLASRTLITRSLPGHITITIPIPSTTNSSITLPLYSNAWISVMPPTPTNIYIVASVVSMEWQDDEYDVANKISSLITIFGGSILTLTSFPFWIWVLEEIHGTVIPVNTVVANGANIWITPNVVNLGEERSGYVVLTDNYGDTISIFVKQLMSNVTPGITIQVSQWETSEFTISDASASGTLGVPTIDITFTPNHPSYGYNVQYTVHWGITKNGGTAGSGLFTVNNLRPNVKTVTMTSNLASGDVVVINLFYTILID